MSAVLESEAAPLTSGSALLTISDIHDLGFIPRIQDGVKGFEIRTGGGTSIMPRVGHCLKEFVPMSEFLKVCEAVIRLFERADELRKNRSKARIKDRSGRVVYNGCRDFRMGRYISMRNLLVLRK